ncbi:hypothetical protein Q757_09180, partial [Oenococcus alcoholitolerans]
ERNVSEEMPFPFNKISLSIYNKRLHHQNLTEEEDHFAKERFVWVKEFVDADKYVFANPMYNLFLPAELKSYIDIVMQVPYTFHYTKEGVAEGLLRDKKALHIQANGGTYHSFDGTGAPEGLDFGDKYLQSVLQVMGVTDYQRLFIEGIDHDPSIKDAVLKKVKLQAEQLAADF